MNQSIEIWGAAAGFILLIIPFAILLWYRTGLATTGLVSLPGMMTGVILAGENPFEAILYQIAIMVAIFTGASLTVLLGIKLTMKKAFTEYGVLDGRIFKMKKAKPQAT